MDSNRTPYITRETRMKNFGVLLLIFISLSILLSCGKSSQSDPHDEEHRVNTITNEKTNTLLGLTMVVKEGSITPDGLAVILKNTSSHERIFSEDFLLEKRDPGKWSQVLVTIEGEYAFNDIGFELAPNGQAEWVVEWKWLYGSLEPGEYRIGKRVLDFRATGDFDEYNLVAEFVLD